MSNISKNHQFIVEGEIQSAFGFYLFYYNNLKFYSNPEMCFEYCNCYFKSIFGYKRYDSFRGFRGFNSKNSSVSIPFFNNENFNSIEILESEYLISWFKNKGFDNWISFKSLVLHFYPEILELDLLSFWNKKSIMPQVLKNVGFVKQIIGN